MVWRMFPIFFASSQDILKATKNVLDKSSKVLKFDMLESPLQESVGDAVVLEAG